MFDDEEEIGGDTGMGGGDNDAIDTLKDALQEALDNDQMGLVSKIAAAIEKLQNSSGAGADVLAGAEEEQPLDTGVDDESAFLPNDIPSDEASVEPESSSESESSSEGEDDSPDKDKSEKSAFAKESTGAGGPAPTPVMGGETEVAAFESSGTDEVKAKVMEAVAEGLDEALGTDVEIPADEESDDEDDEDEDEDEDEEESETEERNEEIADNPFEQCNPGTMKSALKKASETSFRDLLSMKKSWQFGVDGRFAKMEPSADQLGDLQPGPGFSDDAETTTDEVEEIPLENIESAKAELKAPDALEPGVRTEVEESSIDTSNQTAPDQIDDVGTPLNVSNEDSGLGPEDDTDVPVTEEEESLEEVEKSATLDEIGKPCEDLKSGKSSKPKDMLDDVDEKKSPSGSATPKPTVADDVGEDKGRGTAENPGDLLDDIDAKKGEGSAKNVPDMLDDVGHEKRSTEHTVKPGTGLLDDVKEMKKSVQDNGKHIMSMKELMSIRKSGQRPDAITSTSGEIIHHELGDHITKSATGPSVRMGHGVDPHKVTENDWAEYKIYKAQKR